MNYQLETEKIIKSLKNKPKLLLHSCCAPCSTYVVEYLAQHFDVCMLYYNPNIFPLEEYHLRLAEVNKLAEHFDVKYMETDWDNEQFCKAVKGLENEPEGGKRCEVCIAMRMQKTAELAKELNYDYFTTSLSISPLKNAKMINEIGERLQNEFGVLHLTSDFKKKDGYKKSTVLSNELGFYRQNFCGCVYSMRDRDKKD